MLKPVIECFEGKVKLSYPHLPDFELNMDFTPIINRFHLTGKFCLLHWQAKPFGLRRWGIYESRTDKYFSETWDKLEINSNCIPLQLNELATTTVPTAVLFFKDAKVTQENYTSISKWKS